MISATFDTYSLVKKLQSSGIAEAQAEAIIEVVREVNAGNDNNYSSKHEVTEFKSEMKHDFTKFQSEMKNEFSQFKSEMKHDMAMLEQRLIVKMGAMIMALGGVLIAIKFLA